MSIKSVVVAGGGIGGLTFAAAARQAGFHVTLIERDMNVIRSNAGSGIGLWTNALASLEV